MNNFAMVLMGISIGIILTVAIFFLLFRSRWSLFFGKPTPQSIRKRAEETGVTNEKLTTEQGGIKTNHYELLQRIRFEDSYKVTIIALLAAIISALAAVIASFASIVH